MGFRVNAWRVVTHPVAPVVVSLLSIFFIFYIVLQNSTDIGALDRRLIATFDTRLLVYAKGCPVGGDAACDIGDAVEVFTASVESAARACDDDKARYSYAFAAQTPQQWDNSSKVYQYPYPTSLNPTGGLYWRQWWAPIVYNFSVVVALLYVYSASLFFQARHAVIAHEQRPPVEARVIHLQTQNALADEHVVLLHHAPPDVFRIKQQQVAPRPSPPAAPCFARWVEYALTSSVQILFFAFLMRNISINEGMLIFCAQLLLCMLGYSVEVELCAGRLWQAWFLHACPWLVHFVLWSIILDNFTRFEKDASDCVAGLDGAPEFVRWIIISQSFFFALFGLTQLGEIGAVTYNPCAIARYFAYADKSYAFLNVVSKFFIATVLLINYQAM